MLSGAQVGGLVGRWRQGVTGQRREPSQEMVTSGGHQSLHHTPLMSLPHACSCSCSCHQLAKIYQSFIFCCVPGVSKLV